MKRILSMACLLAAVVPLAHASTVRADKLPPPKSMACLQVKEAISYTITRGLLRIPFEIELGKGAYVSEYEDAKGVYYRAPSGSITERRSDQKADSTVGRRMTFAGGIYVPNEAAAAPTLYKYYATEAVANRFAPDTTDCTTLTYTVDPHANKVNVLALGAATGIGAATGMAVGRMGSPHIHASYGQAAGIGLVGGLIGGLIVGAIENSKIGEIVPGPALDSQAGEKIRALLENKVAMQERGHAGTSNTVAAVPAAPMAADTQVAETHADANADVPATIEPASSEPSAAPANAAMPAVTTAMVDSPLTALAQGVANQLGCGAVKASGAGGFVASCGSYGVFIDCDAGKCRPLHTVKLEADQQAQRN